MHRAAYFVALAMCLPPAGCCSLSRFFCGPDRSPWISIDFTTPELAVHTLLESLRRDDPEVVYLCLSNDYRRRLNLDQATAQWAWGRIREANPGLHLAGYAEVPPAQRFGTDRATVALDVEGHPIEVQLVRQSRWQVRYRRDDGTRADPGAGVDSAVGFVDLQPIDGAERSRVVLAPLTIRHDGLEHVPLEALEFVGFEREWKIADLRTPAH